MKKFYIICLLALTIIILPACRITPPDRFSHPTPTLFLEITADNTLPEVSRFHVSSTIISSTPYLGGRYEFVNVELGEIDFLIPVTPATLAVGGATEFRIYQILQEMILTDDTNRFSEHEWISDEGWIIDEGVFYLTITATYESQMVVVDQTIYRYENGVKTEVDEVRFINHYEGFDD